MPLVSDEDGFRGDWSSHVDRGFRGDGVGSRPLIASWFSSCRSLLPRDAGDCTDDNGSDKFDDEFGDFRQLSAMPVLRKSDSGDTESSGSTSSTDHAAKSRSFKNLRSPGAEQWCTAIFLLYWLFHYCLNATKNNFFYELSYHYPLYTVTVA